MQTRPHLDFDFWGLLTSSERERERERYERTTAMWNCERKTTATAAAAAAAQSAPIFSSPHSPLLSAVRVRPLPSVDVHPFEFCNARRHEAPSSSSAMARRGATCYACRLQKEERTKTKEGRTDDERERRTRSRLRSVVHVVSSARAEIFTFKCAEGAGERAGPLIPKQAWFQSERASERVNECGPPN